MEQEITRKSVLLECLSIMRQEMAACSKNFNRLEPKENMREAWEQCRRKVEILKDLIHAYDTEPVRAALAGWQQDVMKNGPSALKLDQEPEDTAFSSPVDALEIRIG